MKSPREKFYRRCEDRLALRIIKRNLDFYLSELSSFFSIKIPPLKRGRLFLNGTEETISSTFSSYSFLFPSKRIKNEPPSRKN